MVNIRNFFYINYFFYNKNMKITKLGHCCLLIEEKGLRILTDPGAYSEGQNELKNIDVILITHEHQDHLHIGSLKTILENNSDVKVITNSGVGKILEKENIKYELIEDGQANTIGGILIEGFGKVHADIYKTITPVMNTGYFIANRFLYPGDALYNPKKRVEILALPITGPWMTMAQGIDYALEIKPKVCFPVHDGMIQEDRMGPLHRFPKEVLSKEGIDFKVLPLDTEVDFG